MSDGHYHRIINAANVATVLEVDDRTARRVMSRMRKRFDKEKHQPVTLEEFLLYTKLKLEFVYAKLGWKKP